MNSGKILIFIGIVIVILGFIVYFFGDKLNWFGKLPGDIRIDKDNFKFRFPLVSMLILSLVLNLVLWIFKKYF